MELFEGRRVVQWCSTNRRTTSAFGGNSSEWARRDNFKNRLSVTMTHGGQHVVRGGAGDLERATDRKGRKEAKTAILKESGVLIFMAPVGVERQK